MTATYGRRSRLPSVLKAEPVAGFRKRVSQRAPMRQLRGERQRPEERSMSRLLILTAAAALLGAGAPAAASAQSPPTIVATGTATAKPEPSDRQSETSIREAVEAANAKALPKAIADA